MLFKMFDADSSGDLQRNELKNCLKEAAKQLKIYRKCEIKGYFSRLVT